MTTETKKQPAAKIKVGSVQAAIWKNSSEKGDFYNATFDLSYRDANGQWHNNARSYGPRELLHLAKAALLADSEIGRLKAADRKAAGEDAAPENDAGE
jgi:hypothetical protein